MAETTAVTRPGKLETFQVSYEDAYGLPLDTYGYSFVITGPDGDLEYQATQDVIVQTDMGQARTRWVIDLPEGEGYTATWHANHLNPDGVVESRVALTDFTVAGIEQPEDGVWVTVPEAEGLRGKSGVTAEAIGAATRWVEKITRYEVSDIEWLQRVPWGAEEIRNIKKAVAARAFGLMPRGATEGSLAEMELGFGRTITSLSQPGGMSVGFQSVSRPSSANLNADEDNDDTRDAVFYLRRLRRVRNPQDSQPSNGNYLYGYDGELVTPELAQARFLAYFYPGNSEGKFRKSDWLHRGRR